MRKIYDCFCFFNELDLLELRLNILDDYVDYFVISEASVTHTGQPKPYYYEENKERFKKWEHKIIHLKIEDTPNDFLNLPLIPSDDSFDAQCVADIHNFAITQTNRFNRTTEIHYGRDFYQKECIRRGLENCNDEDIIISSDCDEIPNPEVLKRIDSILDTGTFFSFSQDTYYYYMNLLKEREWKGSRIGRYKDLKDYSYNELRANSNTVIPNGGWHFSFMGGAEKVKTKITSYSAQEMNNPNVINSIESNIEKGIDPFFRGNLTKVEIDDSYPEYLLKNIDLYKNMIK
jgi:beta-1,4-mannosyl-glycoprotein beta-1,4-N-acetylglucosaminyltransferase|tara:strand:+ start:298 stop:1164 length:867 start_codon:yes stop_codon:yes gene_type:complete